MMLAAVQANLFADEHEQPGAETSAALYRCRHCEQTTKRPHIWRQTFKRTHAGQQPPISPCRTCQRPTTGQTVRGRFSAGHRCDARCIYAKGPECECSCAGANHGAGHGG